MKTLIRILIGIAVVVMAYLCVMSIYTPEQFDREQSKREQVIEERLKELTQYQLAYRSVHGCFANAEQLVDFLQNGRIYYINAEGDYTDAMREKGITEEQAAHQGLIQRDTVYVSAKDSLLKKDVDPTDLVKVPNMPNEKIDIQASTIDQYIGQDTVQVAVFRMGVPMDIYLQGMDAQLIEAKKQEAMARNNGKGYPGLVIGSLEELKTTGNWE